MIIIGLSTLPYLHDFITDAQGLQTWVPVIGIENLLLDANNTILGFSTYRVFLYTFLIFFFATIGWVGWYRNAKNKYYCYTIILVIFSGIYQLLLIAFNLRRTVFNELPFKLITLVALFTILGYLAYQKHGINIKKFFVGLSFLIIATFPYLHDIITERSGDVRSIFPNLGIEKLLTDSDGLVRGLRNYRLLIYLFGIYVFSHIGWLGWFMSSQGKRYRPFLLVPAALSLYQIILIVMSWRETEFNSPSLQLFITIGLSILIAINFYFNNKISLNTKIKAYKHEKSATID